MQTERIAPREAIKVDASLRAGTRWRSLGVLLVLAAVMVAVVIAAIPASPRYMAFPGRDSGVFLYVAGQILDGKIPYRDVWDHKSPGIYYLDALGLLLADGSVWGVWVLELIMWEIAAVACFWLLAAAFGAGAATVGSAALVGGIVLVLQGGGITPDRFVTGDYQGTNLTETYALAFQFTALAMLYAAERRGHYGWRGVLIGTSSAACLLLRPNLIAIPIAIVVVLAITAAWGRRWRYLLAAGGSIAIGAATPLALVAAYFTWHGALDDLIDAVFRYNAVYSQNRFYSPTETMALGYQILSQSGMSIVALLGLGVGIALLPVVSSAHQRLIAVLLVAAPLELVLSTMSGRTYGHYFLPWLPIGVTLVGLVVYALQRALATIGEARGAAFGVASALAAITIAMSVVPAWSLYHFQYQRDDSASHIRLAIADYITDHTTSEDDVLIWGAEAGMNFMSGRTSPTRYVYQYPLYTVGYQDDAQIERFLRDLQANPPRMVIDASSTATWIPPIDSAARATWLANTSATAGFRQAYDLLPRMGAVYAFLETHYRRVDAVEAPGGNQWPVYERIEGSIAASGDDAGSFAVALAGDCWQSPRHGPGRAACLHHRHPEAAAEGSPGGAGHPGETRVFARALRVGFSGRACKARSGSGPLLRSE